MADGCGGAVGIEPAGCRRAVVEELAALGAAVHTCSRKEAELGERLKEWEARGFRGTTSVCDLSVREQRERLIGDVAERFGGKLNILVSWNQIASSFLFFLVPSIYHIHPSEMQYCIIGFFSGNTSLL